MTPAQRLAHALYGSHGPDMVAGAQAFAKRQIMDGYAIVPTTATWAQLHAGQKAWLADPERKSSTLYAAMIQAYQQEINTPAPVSAAKEHPTE